MQVRRSLAAALAVGSLFLVGACAGSDPSDSSGDPSTGTSDSAASDQGPVRISGQSFPEAALVAAMYDELLTKAGYDTDVMLVDTRDAYMATFTDSIDVVPEYVGGILEFLNGTYNGSNAAPVTMSDAAQSISDAQPLLKKAGITLLDPSAATDSNAFFVTKKFADDNNVSTLSDLKGKSVVLAAAPDCKGRLDCEGGLTDKYGIKITKILPLGYASPQTYKSVLSGESQLGETSTTDATLESQGLVLLEDDKKIQPAENLVPAVSSDFLAAHPDVAAPLNALMAALTTENLTQLNADVSVTGRTRRTWRTSSSPTTD